MKKLLTGFILLTAVTSTFAQLIQTALTCRVLTEVKRNGVVIDKKNETVTVELNELNDTFTIAGFGELATIYGTNDLRNRGITSMVDLSTNSILEVEFRKFSVNANTGKELIVDMTLKLDRVSGYIKASSTYKTSKSSLLVTGNCEKSSKKF